VPDNGYWVSFRGGENVLKLDIVHDFVIILNNIVNCTLQVGQFHGISIAS
jgi:hypothetical protein